MENLQKYEKKDQSVLEKLKKITNRGHLKHIIIMRE